MPTVYLGLSKFCLCGRITSAQHALYVKGIDSFQYDLVEKKAKVVYQEDNISIEEIMEILEKRYLEVESIEEIKS
ncbi:hypothetical protein [Peloplasma aerotolerans]|uniref:Uncharacterized protein n=1 Tax=Peloplasma aerotolerans TaxID=3044389 RepID=A0AAW6U2S3_9MOLU|nr:hypothetical protein [Mariniplasma sp. M4Ah]MDI6452271.1 hypothetical protein [Mariniplasma sp. M4Ah]MDR4968331.1 hypothetical protein [Acholeplasmataceae bacterium]